MPCGSKYFSVSTALGGELFYEYGLQPHNSNIIVDFFSKINVFPVHDRVNLLSVGESQKIPCYELAQIVFS